MYNRDTNGKGGNASNEPRASSPKPRKHKPLWLKPRDSSGVAGPPKFPTGSNCDWQCKQSTRWTNSKELSLQELLDRNTVSYLPAKSPNPRTAEPYKPLSRQDRRMAPSKVSAASVTAPSGTAAKTSASVTAPSGTDESRPTRAVDYDNMFAEVRIQQCYVDDNADRIFFRIEDLYRGASVKPAGALVPILDKLVARTQGAEPKPVVETETRVPIETSPTRAKSLLNQKKPQRSPRRQTTGPKMRLRCKAPISSECKVEEEKHDLKRPKAYVVTKGCAIRDQIAEKKRLFSMLTSLDPFDNVEIAMPKAPRPQPARARESTRKQDRWLDTPNLQEESDREWVGTKAHETSSDKKMAKTKDSSEDGLVDTPAVSFMERGCEPTPAVFGMKSSRERSSARKRVESTSERQVESPVRTEVEISPAVSQNESCVRTQMKASPAVSRNESCVRTEVETTSERPGVNKEESRVKTEVVTSPAVSGEHSPARRHTEASPAVSRDNSPARTRQGITHVEVSGQNWRWSGDFGVGDLVDETVVTQLDGFHHMSEAGTSMSKEDGESQTEDSLMSVQKEDKSQAPTTGDNVLENGLMSVRNEDESKKNNIEQKEIEKKEMEKKEMEKKEMEKKEMEKKEMEKKDIEKKNIEKKSLDRRSPSIF